MFWAKLPWNTVSRLFPASSLFRITRRHFKKSNKNIVFCYTGIILRTWKVKKRVLTSDFIGISPNSLYGVETLALHEKWLAHHQLEVKSYRLRSHRNRLTFLVPLYTFSCMCVSFNCTENHCGFFQMKENNCKMFMKGIA